MPWPWKEKHHYDTYTFAFPPSESKLTSQIRNPRPREVKPHSRDHTVSLGQERGLQTRPLFPGLPQRDSLGGSKPRRGRMRGGRVAPVNPQPCPSGIKFHLGKQTEKWLATWRTPAPLWKIEEIIPGCISMVLNFLMGKVLLPERLKKQGEKVLISGCSKNEVQLWHSKKNSWYLKIKSYWYSIIPPISIPQTLLSNEVISHQGLRLRRREGLHQIS